jgi:hypothetical protein
MTIAAKPLTADDLWNMPGTITPLRATDTLSGETVLPGFSIPVSELFA